jgi:hypothetical protein
MAAAPEGGTVSSCATNLFGPTAGLCGLPTRQGTGSDQLQRTEREKYHARRGKRPNTTHRRKYPSAHTGAAKAAGDWRLGRTVYEVYSLLPENSSVASVNVQTAYLGGRIIQPRRLGDCGARQRSRPRGRNSGPRCNEHRWTDCGDLRPSYTGWHRAG